MSKKFDLDNFLKEAERNRKTCAYCRDDTLWKIVEKFLDKKAAGETSISFHYFYQRCLVEELGAPKNQQSAYRHVRACLKRDPTTGRPLNEKEG